MLLTAKHILEAFLNNQLHKLVVKNHYSFRSRDKKKDIIFKKTIVLPEPVFAAS